MSTFDEQAATWDTPERVERAQLVAQVIRAHVPIPPRARIIDLGAGTGLLGLAVADGSGTVVLAEPSAGMRDEAIRKVALLGRRDVTIAPYGLGEEAAPAGAFDLAISLLVLHHVDDTAACLRDVHRLLAPGGWMALADLDTEDGSFHVTTTEGIHHHGFDRRGLERLATEVGFVDVTTADAMTIERDGRHYPLFLLLGRRLGT